MLYEIEPSENNNNNNVKSGQRIHYFGQHIPIGPFTY